MKLYEIDEQINEILNSGEINEETGEVVIDFEKLEFLQMEKKEKIKNVIRYYLDLSGDTSKFSEEIKALSARKKSLENKQDSIKRFLDKLHGGQSAEYDTHKISYRKSSVVEGELLESLPEDFVEVKKQAKKAEIKKAIEAGLKIDGWKIVERSNIQIK